MPPFIVDTTSILKLVFSTAYYFSLDGHLGGCVVAIFFSVVSTVILIFVVVVVITTVTFVVGAIVSMIVYITI